MPSSLLVFLLFNLLSLHLHPFFNVFYTIMFTSFLYAAYLIAFTPHTVHNFLSSKFKVALRMRTCEENGVAHEAIVIEWAVSSAS